MVPVAGAGFGTDCEAGAIARCSVLNTSSRDRAALARNPVGYFARKASHTSRLSSFCASSKSLCSASSAGAACFGCAVAAAAAGGGLAKKKGAAIGDDDTQGCCEPPVTCCTESPTSLKVSNRPSPGLRIVALSAFVYGLLLPSPSWATLPGCVA